MTTLLQQAIDLAKAGQREAAEALLRRVLAEQPDNEIAWMWLSGVTRDVLAKQEALRRALKINPRNELARRGLERFGGAPAEAEPRPEVPPISEELEPEAPPPFDFGLEEEAEPQPPPATPPPSPPPSSLPSPSRQPAAEPPPSVFEFDLSAEETPAEEGFDWGEPPDFSFDEELPPSVPPLAGEDIPEELLAPPDKPAIDSESLEELIAGEETAAEEPEEPPVLTEPALPLEALEEVAEKPVDAELLAELRRRQQKQQQMLIIGAILFTLLVICSCGIYYYVTQVLDIYEVAPQLAGPELQLKAPKPKAGVSTLKFRGYPASRARIEWVQDDGAETCAGGHIGLTVDFQNGLDPVTISNRVCREGNCSLEKELPPVPVKDVTVTYKCGKSAVITLYK